MAKKKEPNLILRLRNVNGSPLSLKGRVELVRLRDNKEIQKPRSKITPEIRYALQSTKRGEDLFWRIPQAEGYRGTRCKPFRWDPPTGREHTVRLFRQPKYWKPDFEGWDALPPRFRRLKELLEGSQAVWLKNPRGETGFRKIGDFSGHAYDNVTGAHFVFAKAALLNLHKMASSVMQPFARESWFSFVKEIVVIDRERIVARVDNKMAKVVRRVRADPKELGYKSSIIGGHAKNIPPDHTFQQTDENAVTIKSDHKKGNLQFILFEGVTAPNGKSVTLADIDIDEHGDIFGHINDVLFRHPASGGTNPLDVYEIITDRNRKVPAGYRLERKT